MLYTAKQNSQNNIMGFQTRPNQVQHNNYICP